MNNTLNAEENIDRVDMAIVEYFDLVDSGQPVDQDDFIARHEDLRDELSSFFDAAGEVESLAGPTLVEYSQAYASAETSALLDTHSAVTTKHNRQRPHLEPGTEFGRYRVEGELGQGAMGSVYLAFDTQLARQVALKIPIFDEQQEPEMIERFYREARVAATLRSPHICPVFDVDKINDIHFIAMAYIEGEALSHFISTNQLRPREIATIIGKLAQSLQKAHDGGVVHRDLKPNNIMIDGEGEPVVMDFGLARCSDQTDIRSTKAGAIIGSPAYMSPEQMIGDHETIGPAADVYSLGVIFYEMLTGQLPYRGSVISVIGQVMGPDDVPRSSLLANDPHLATICETMMAKRLEDRYASMNDVTRAIDAYLNNKPAIAAHTATKPTPHTAQPNPPMAPHTPIELMRGDFDVEPTLDSRAYKLFACFALFAALFVCFAGGIGYLALSKPRANANNEGSQSKPNKDKGNAAGDNDQRQSQPKKVDVKAPSIPKSAHSSVPSLRYSWKKEMKFGYAIKMEAKLGSLTETLEGTLVYNVVESKKGNTRIRFDSRLSSKNNSRGPSVFTYARVSNSFPSFREIVGSFPKHEFVVDRRGKVLENGCEANLPFALGCLGQIPIETFGETGRWKHESEVKIDVYRRSSRFRPSPFRQTDESESLNVEKVISASVTKSSGGEVVLDTRYTFSADDESRFAATGTSELQFNRKLGLVTKKTMSLDVTDRTQEIAVSLQCTLLSESQLADQMKRFQSEPQPISAKEQAHINALTMPDIPAELRVTGETVLKANDPLQAYRGGKWHDVKVIETLDDGQVKIHWIGFGSELDQPFSRARLRLVPKSN